ncbi:MAG: hypothetical protein Q9169_002031 [Polycauliona sp. 2 TL-2023]
MMSLGSRPNASSPLAVAGNTPLRIWHCTQARTASNVLAKQFRAHPQLAPKEYTFMIALENSGGIREPSHAAKATFQNAFHDIQEFLASAEQEGKHIFIKEHIWFMLDPRVKAAALPSESRPLKSGPEVFAQAADSSANSGSFLDGDGRGNKTNPSVLPDSFMRTLAPIIQIRHPAIAIPSYYRAITFANPEHDVHSQDLFAATTLAWCRMTFDWFCEHVFPRRKDTSRGHDSWPLVVDGDDLLNENERVIAAICSIASLDVKWVVGEWDAASEENKQKISEQHRPWVSTLQASNGVIKSGLKGEDIKIGDEAETWIKEFGPAIAKKLKELVEATMDDYLYLAQFRI